ncbi:MAG: hypothetical protein QM780_14875 [Hyphomicrobium sp.]|uniref:hypothetical protein n=1 Tax=Hyphomicrobium sp. TaxID=82 RepID=UPI0039E2BED2
MKRFAIVAGAMLAMSVPAFADTPLTEDEMKSATAAASGLGCEGGKWEKETEGSGVYELDDAKCKGGQYDLKFDKDFKLLDMDAD